MCRHFSLLALILSVSAPSFASVVVYTDRLHPPANATAETRVIYLDETERLQQKMFGTLSKDSALAERQAQSSLRAADWPQKQAALAQAYQGLLQAWQLGLQKYPAVVFDDRDVVYGTADVRGAQAQRAAKVLAGAQP
ncbi:TIGR03757 family integrating conjugative element protein [Salmonella enterica subsp. enterica serovar Virchow]|nr:TIGR03757 family integrating conjugative element protein [Salmonella enterica subsp. enterica serovar Virchow]